MRIRNKKIPFIVYISLLAIILPITVFSIYLHSKGYGSGKTRDTNVNKLFKYEGKLYFYDEGILVGTYTCETTACDYAKETIDDNNYVLDYYEDNSIEPITGLYNHRYVFISDTADKVILYDALKEEIISEFLAVKNYTIGLENDRFIVKLDNNLWGVIDLSGEFPNRIISYQYNYIGVQNQIINDGLKLESDLFAVYVNNAWKIVNSQEVLLSTDFTEPIFKYDNNSVITKQNNMYHLYDYSAKKILEKDYKYANYLDKYFLLVDNANIVYTYEKSNGFLSEKGYIRDISSIEIKDNKDVYYDGSLKFSI